MSVRLALPVLALACACNDPRVVASGSSGDDAAPVLPDASLDAEVDALVAVGGTPRLIAPLSTSSVTQRRPTLH
jgi:hypothetical protein